MSRHIQFFCELFLSKPPSFSQLSDSCPVCFMVKVHFSASVSSFLKISEMTETAGHGNVLCIRIIKSGQKARDGRKGSSLAFCPLCYVV